ncbi:MAG: T9SS type A sorting domain-containing protein, partial [Ignavibacteria bacterium]
FKGYYDTYFGASNTGYHGAWNVFPYYNSGKFVVSDMQTGLWVFRFTGASGITPISGEPPKDFKLHQNFPNPFNPSTTIEFDISKSGNISLKIYDALGKEIETVFQGYQFAGKYSLNYNAKNLASGIYYYALRADDFSDVKKMVLVK